MAKYVFLSTHITHLTTVVQNSNKESEMKPVKTSAQSSKPAVEKKQTPVKQVVI